MHYLNVVTGQRECHSPLIGDVKPSLPATSVYKQCARPCRWALISSLRCRWLRIIRRQPSDKAADQAGGRRPGIHIGRAMASA
jgi:hypothetical protein